MDPVEDERAGLGQRANRAAPRNTRQSRLRRRATPDDAAERRRTRDRPSPAATLVDLQTSPKRPGSRSSTPAAICARAIRSSVKTLRLEYRGDPDDAGAVPARGALAAVPLPSERHPRAELQRGARRTLAGAGEGSGAVPARRSSCAMRPLTPEQIVPLLTGWPPRSTTCMRAGWCTSIVRPENVFVTSGRRGQADRFRSRADRGHRAGTRRRRQPADVPTWRRNRSAASR